MTETLDKVITGVSRSFATNVLHDWQKHLERDPVVIPVLLMNKFLHLRLSWVLSESPKNVAYLTDWNFSVSPIIEQKEGLLELRYLAFGKLHPTRHFRRLSLLKCNF